MANKLSKSERKELAEKEMQRRAKNSGTKHEPGFAHLRDLEDKLKHEN